MPKAGGTARRGEAPTDFNNYLSKSSLVLKRILQGKNQNPKQNGSRLFQTKNKHTNKQMTTLATCWSMTLNNPDENEMVLIRNPNPEYIRQLIWTPEEGEEGTPHIQAYIKLMKQQRMSFIKKLYPRGHFKSITSDEYKHNCSHYAQKNDDTTIGSHVITYNEQIPDNVQFLRAMISEAISIDITGPKCEDQEHWMDTYFHTNDIIKSLDVAERAAVKKRPSVAKLIVSPTYARVKKLYLREITENILIAFYYKDADDNEGERSGETNDVQSVTISCASEEEEGYEEGGCTTNEGSDCGSESDSETEGGDEIEY